MEFTIEDMKPLVKNHEELVKFWNKAEKKRPKEATNKINLRGYVNNYMTTVLEKGLTDANGADIVVNINSYGGDVFAGFELYTLLKEYKGKVTTKVTGVAASAGALTFLAGDEREIGPHGMVMFHPAASYAVGFAEDMAKAKNLLDKIDKHLVAAMQEHMDLSGITDIRNFLLEEKFLDKDEALELKAATNETEDDPEMTEEEKKEMEEKEKEMEGDPDKEKNEDPDKEEMTAEQEREYIALYRKEMEKHNRQLLINHVQGGTR